MSARDRILERVRRATEGRGDPAAATERLASRAQTAPTPAMALSDGLDRTERFVEMAVAAAATLSRIDGPDALPHALAEELRARNLAPSIRCGTDPLFDRDWGGLEVSRGPGRLQEPATLSRALLGSAETGTVLLTSGAENPVTLTFLGETHFVALSEADICGGYEEMWGRLRATGLDPRTVNLVTGPSRSADIGQTLQLGAHGPVALHIFLMP
ncbi:MAG: lactate utilization protein C [Pikeienuella sp.]